jgi:hypothetical protein
MSRGFEASSQNSGAQLPGARTHADRCPGPNLTCGFGVPFCFTCKAKYPTATTYSDARMTLRVPQP